MKQSIILLHGLFGGLSNWQSVIARFNDTYDIHVPPLPLFDEHGKDDLEYLVNWLQHYIDSAGLKNVILLGNSLGGHVAILYTHRHSENVQKLILTGSSGLFENTTLGRYPRRHDFSYIRGRVENIFYDPKVASDELVDMVFQIVGDDRKCIRIVRTAKRAQRNYVTKELTEITVPVLLIWGTDDRVTPPNVAEEFKQLLPDAQLVFLADCGHAPMMERPEEFNRVLEGFL